MNRGATAGHRGGLRRACGLSALLALLLSGATGATTILFIGNSFTYGEAAGAAPTVKYFRPATVTDLNGEHLGGVPALFKAMTEQAGLDYQVSLETAPGKGLDFHYAQRRAVLRGHYDKVLLQSYSTLDAARPGNPQTLIKYSGLLAKSLREITPNVDLMLVATWSRADQVYRGAGPWRGTPIGQMARDVRCGYDAAAVASAVSGHAIPVIAVGETWNRVIDSGLADPDPYDGIDAGRIDLWAPDHYHASTEGYYLAALSIFGAVTGKDPAMFGRADPVARDLGIDGVTAAALQRHASAQQAAEALRRPGDGCAAAR